MATVSQQEGWKDEGGREGWSESEVWERVTVVGSEREEDKEGRAGGRERKKGQWTDMEADRGLQWQKPLKKRVQFSKDHRLLVDWYIFWNSQNKTTNKKKNKT